MKDDQPSERRVRPSRSRTTPGPLAGWTICLRESTDLLPRETIYPGPDASFGVARTHIGRIVIEPSEQLIVAIPRSGGTRRDHDKLLSKAQRDRDDTDFGLGISSPQMIANLTQPIEVSGDLGTSENVVRCTVLGCDRFMGWHRADARDEQVVGENHVAGDLGTESFRCRLLYVKNVWVLDVGTKTAMRDNPTESATALAAAVLKLSALAEELNMSTLGL